MGVKRVKDAFGKRTWYRSPFKRNKKSPNSLS